MSSSVQGMYGALGCVTWYDANDRGCDNRNFARYFHSLHAV